MGPYVSMYMDSNRSLCVFIGPLSSLWILMRFYRSL